MLTSFTLGGNFDQSKPEAIASVLSLLRRLEDDGLAASVGRFAFKPIMQAGTKETESFITNLGEGDFSGFFSSQLDQLNDLPAGVGMVYNLYDDVNNPTQTVTGSFVFGRVIP